MAFLDPQEAFEDFSSRTLAAIRKQFPVTGKKQSLHLDKLELGEVLHPDDIRSQHEAKSRGGSWSTPVFAHLSLKDNDGKTIDSRRVRVAELPAFTRRYSQILDGREYQVDNQWQLKPGVYTRRRQNGELEARFNTIGAKAFDVVFDPASKHFIVDRRKSKLPIYPIMKAMGVSDADMEASWGREIYEANKYAPRTAGTLERLYKSDRRTLPSSATEAEEYTREALSRGQLRPDATEITLGKPFTNITGEALRLATRKMLRVQAGHPEDDRDSLQFKDFRTVGDFAHDKVMTSARNIKTKMMRQINTARNVRDVVKFDHFNKAIRDTFHGNAAARTPSQLNPLEMISSSQQTTIMGEGGIKKEESVLDEAKFINPSHLGYLDPINTPEGTKTGVTLRLPMGVRPIYRRRGDRDIKEAQLNLYNIKTGKFESVGPAKFNRSKIVLPDQVKWSKEGKPSPLMASVKYSAVGNNIEEGKFSDADYVMRHPSQLFNVTSNLIPFLGNNSGNRASMATRHMEQAISLVNREEPLVQVASPSKRPGMESFEGLVGTTASHFSPVSGKVTNIKNDAVVIQGDDGKSREVQIYRNYKLNDAKSVLDSTPTVKVGDRVKAGQVVADSNFSRNGKLALGTNLRVAFIPYKGLNFEDGVVISESAADKLKSLHLHEEALSVDKDTNLSKKKFMVHHPGAFKREQYESIGDDGLVRIGSRVEPGDPLILATKSFKTKGRTGIGALRKSLSGAHSDRSVRWEAEHPGEVVAIHKKGKDVVVHVKTTEPMQVGDKLAGRFGNKGIVTAVLPDKEMPHTKDGQPIQVLLNPSGVPGRMNPGQVFETVAGKLAKKTGKTYLVNNFGHPQEDVLARIKAEIKAAKISDTEELFDPTTKKSMGKVLAGNKYLFKLVHQIDKKVSARSGMGLPGGESAPEHYDLNLQPTGGGHTGGQSIGSLSLYAMLAHGAKANLREMMTYKSEGEDPTTVESKRWPSQHSQVWKAIQTGSPIPTPKTTFAFQKFTDYLRGAGINVEKKGHAFILSPFTDQQVKALSGGRQLTKPSELLYAKLDKNGDPKPKPGGLFDERLTGGHGGRKWSHIRLAEPIPNPVFEDAIRRVTGLKKTEFSSVVNGEKGISDNGKIVSLGTAGSLTGGAGIKKLLDGIDVDKDLANASRELGIAPRSKLDPLLKKVKHLRALKDMGMKPSEAYVLHNLPVIPPALRPVSIMKDGNFNYADLNGLYKEFAEVNDALGDPTLMRHLPDSFKKDTRAKLYDGVKALMGVGVPYGDAVQKGILHQIAGAQPKRGYFQNTLTNRRQDLSMRSTIVPEPALGLDEVGLPREQALTLFRPFVIRQLTMTGAATNPLTAAELIAKKKPIVYKALERVAEDRPVLLTRHPVLHKYGIQAFKPKIVSGVAIRIHPLVVSGYNADFDGDQMSAFVPVSREAVDEAKNMFPSNNLFSDASGKVMYQPTLESALGLYKLSRVRGATPKKTFNSPAQALTAAQKQQIHVNDLISLGKKKTTVGRMLLSATLPEPMQSKVMDDLNFRVDKKGLDYLFTTLAKNHQGDYGDTANKLKDLGNGMASGSVPVFHSLRVGSNALNPKFATNIPVNAHTLALDDLATDKMTRAKVLGVYRKKVQNIQNSPSFTKSEKDRRVAQVWMDADKQMGNIHKLKEARNPTNLFTMYAAGVKPSWSQYKQMVLAPMVMSDSKDQPIPTPVTKSYGEGLDIAGYWTVMHGARKGTAMKVEEVRKPGALTKGLVNTTMDTLITGDDCGTARGIALPISEKDVHDRFLVKPFTNHRFNVPAGTLLTPDIVGKIRAVDKTARVVVRSPLRCEHGKGICAKCAGVAGNGQPYTLGTNIGIMASQSLGERGTQLSMRVFHTGGVAGAGGGLMNNFARFKQLTELPERIPNASTLATKSGTVEKIEKDPTGVKVWIGGRMHHVGKDANGRPLHTPLPTAPKVGWEPPKIGMKVQAGHLLSDPTRTSINPHDLYKATGNIETVQNFLAGEMYNIYKDEGVKRRHVETVVKSMSNLTKIEDPVDHPTLLRGEFRAHSQIRKMNAERAQMHKRPITHKPVLQGVNMLPLSIQEDWMAKLQHRNLRDTILDAAANRGKSQIHGTHPIPGLAYGAEFGLNKNHAMRNPKLRHLINVSPHHY